MREFTQKSLELENIAYQANLLALNAAIEAARARTHGQELVVEAARIRNLAEGSWMAAQQISEMTTQQISSIAPPPDPK